MNSWERSWDSTAGSIAILILFIGFWVGVAWISSLGDAPSVDGSQTVDNLIEEIEYTRDNPPPNEADDPYTSNNEENDQPVGYYGETTFEACTPHNGHCYTLDTDTDSEGNPETIYFPKGGNIDVGDCNSSDGYTYCYDEDGREWEFEE